MCDIGESKGPQIVRKLFKHRFARCINFLERFIVDHPVAASRNLKMQQVPRAGQKIAMLMDYVALERCIVPGHLKRFIKPRQANYNHEARCFQPGLDDGCREKTCLTRQLLQNATVRHYTKSIRQLELMCS